MEIKHNKIKTDKHFKFQLAMLVVLLVSIGMIIFFIFNKEIPVVRITVFIMCGLFVVLSIIMLVYLNFYYIEVNEQDDITSHKLFSKKTIKIYEIDWYNNKDGLIILIHNGKVFGSFDQTDSNFAIIMNLLEKNKVPLKK